MQAGKNVEACAIVFKTLKDHNYDPISSVDHDLLPKTPEDVAKFADGLNDTKVDKEDIRILVMSLIGSAGYVTVETGLKPDRQSTIASQSCVTRCSTLVCR